MGVAPLCSKRRAWTKDRAGAMGQRRLHQNENAWRIKPAALGWLK